MTPATSGKMADLRETIRQESAGCRIEERHDRGHINLRGCYEDAEFTRGVEEITGLALPTKPNTFASNGQSSAAARIYWLGPDEWQIIANKDRARQLVSALTVALDGQHAAVNDLSAGYVTIELSGAGAATTIAKGSTLDLATRRFGTGCCAQGTIAKANVLLGVITAGSCYELIVRRSFADYLRSWLKHANAG